MTQKKFLPILLLVLAAAAFPACKDEPAGGPDILPGLGLSDVRIGDEAKEALDIYGPTTSTYIEVGGQYIHILNYEVTGILIRMEPNSSPTFDKNMKILSFYLDAPYSGLTAEGFGIGTNKTEVRSAYGQPELSDATTDTYLARGISFSYDAAGKAELINVAKF